MKWFNDLFELEEKQYVLTIDSYSKYSEGVCLNNTTGTVIKITLKAIFARYGNPDMMYMDNGLQFVCREVQNFCSDWDVIHKTSNSYNHQSNGFIELCADNEKKNFLESFHRSKRFKYSSFGISKCAYK